jgi:hypothetical protein
MMIKVAQLKPNPYRNMRNYPVDKEKVAALSASITETEFWDNIIVRPAKENGCYEIAYGHHRLVALQRLSIKEIDIPVKNLSDEQMIRIMANENMHEWQHNPKVITMTIRQVKKFLDKKIAKYKDLEDFHTDESISMNLFASNSQFQKVKKEGVGRDTILKFLGDPWKLWMVQDALTTMEVLDEGLITNKDLDSIDGMTTAREVQKLAKKLVKRGDDKKEVKKTISKVVKTIKKTGAGRRSVERASRLVERFPHVDPVKVIDPPSLHIEPQKEPKTKKIPNIERFATMLASDIDFAVIKLGQIYEHTKHIRSENSKEILIGAIERIILSGFTVYKELEGQTGVNKLIEEVEKWKDIKLVGTERIKRNGDK